VGFDSPADDHRQRRVNPKGYDEIRADRVIPHSTFELKEADVIQHGINEVRRPLSLVMTIVAATSSVGCGGGVPSTELAQKKGTVVVYSALDEEFAKPILSQLADELQLEIPAKYDVESTKTVGLTNEIITESIRPRCDVFWNNEILNTLRLKERGLLAPFDPSHVSDLPPVFRDPDRTWYGFAARARILLVNTKVVPKSERPSKITDLILPRWKGKIGIAKPLFGTTATHAACLFAAWGDEKASKFFKDLKANDVQILSGNKQVATAVGSGRLAFGLTDTDDAVGELQAGSPVVIVYPDRDPDQLGTLFIPNTIAIVKGAPHVEPARRLADHILSAEVESKLASGPSAQIPLLKGVNPPPNIETPATVHPMTVDFGAAAKIWDRVAAFLAEEFAG
jgi:iron(III) transport system substrate-binding protein